jgi:hypothetical protein
MLVVGEGPVLGTLPSCTTGFPDGGAAAGVVTRHLATRLLCHWALDPGLLLSTVVPTISP